MGTIDEQYIMKLQYVIQFIWSYVLNQTEIFACRTAKKVQGHRGFCRKFFCRDVDDGWDRSVGSFLYFKPGSRTDSDLKFV